MISIISPLMVLSFKMQMSGMNGRLSDGCTGVYQGYIVLRDCEKRKSQDDYSWLCNVQA